MASLISIANGNLTDAATWAVCNSTSELDSVAGNTLLATSYASSSAFTPGAITIDAIAVKIASRAASPSGTFSVELYNSTAGASVAGTETTINVSDIHVGDSAANGGCGWYVFKLASPVLLLAATNYQVRAKTSAATQVNLYRNATANNWSRQLRTTTTQAPAAADNLFVAGEWTGAASSTSFTVTMNEVLTTDYGVITVNHGGVLTYGVSDSTDYYLKVSGTIFVYSGGDFRIGTSGAPMPETSTAVLEFDSTSTALFGLQVLSGGAFTAYGDELEFPYTTLAADASASATSLTTADATGWKNGDSIGIASTTRTYTEAEVKSLTADASGTTLTIAALTNAHGGNAVTGVRAHLINRTRNIKIRGVTISTGTGYLLFYAGSTIDMNWVECYNLGSNIGTALRTFEVQTTTASYFRGISCYDNYRGIYASGTTHANVTIENYVAYGNAITGFHAAATSGTGNSISNAVVIRNQYGFYMADLAWNVSNVVLASTGPTQVGFTVIGTIFGEALGTWDNIEIYSGVNSAMNITTLKPHGTISNIKAWRNNSAGVVMSALSQTITAASTTLIIDGLTTFGNNLAGFYLGSTDFAGKVQVNNFTSNGGTTLVQRSAVDFNGSYTHGYIFTNGDFGTTTAHSVVDVEADCFASSTTFDNCKFSSPTEISGQDSIMNAYPHKGIASNNHDQINGNHKRWMRYGTATSDTTIFNNASPSERLTPSSATQKIESSSKFVAVQSGSAATISVYSRKSAVGDGAAYNGNQPRLILRANGALGIQLDTVIDTHTSAVGEWEQLTAITPVAASDGVFEFFVDCDGTTGWVNIDDWSTNLNNDPTGNKYWINGQAYLGAEYSSSLGGGAWTFA